MGGVAFSAYGSLLGGLLRKKRSGGREEVVLFVRGWNECRRGQGNGVGGGETSRRAGEGVLGGSDHVPWRSKIPTGDHKIVKDSCGVGFFRE